MCKVLILLFIIITFIKNPENAPNLLALDHYLPLNYFFFFKYLASNRYLVSWYADQDRYIILSQIKKKIISNQIVIIIVI